MMTEKDSEEEWEEDLEDLEELDEIEEINEENDVIYTNDKNEEVKENLKDKINFEEYDIVPRDNKNSDKKNVVDGNLEYSIPKGYKIIDEYYIDENFCKILILSEYKSDEKLYYIIEPDLKDKEMYNLLKNNIINQINYEKIKEEDIDSLLKTEIKKFLRDLGREVTEKEFAKIFYYLKRDYIGFGVLDPIMRDDKMEDVSADGYNIPLYVDHTDYDYSLKTNIELDKEDLDNLIINLVERGGKQITISNPIVESTIDMYDNKFRLLATLGSNITTRGSSFTIRQPSTKPFTPTRLIKYDTFSPEMLSYLWFLTEYRKNIMIGGGTASGKTSSLNSISCFIPPERKIYSIEDTEELTLYQDNWVPNIAKPPMEDMFKLVKTAMRSRPEIIIVGEIRGEEAKALFQAMKTGHSTYSTIHASTPDEVLTRLKNDPISISKESLKSLDVVCIQELLKGKEEVKRVNRVICEVNYDENKKEIDLNYIYKYDAFEDSFNKVNDSKIIKKISERQGISMEKINKDLENRKEFLEDLYENDVYSLEKFENKIKNFEKSSL
ncbi:MAG: type II/IV secretion system ATPase subunit [archaeon]